MRRYNKRRASHSVSLFPFLAVLICTFGVLIVLLVLVVKAADHQATATKQEVTDRNEAERSELAGAVQLQELRIEGLKSIRPDLLRRLQQARQQRAYLQSSIESLIEDADQLNSQIRLVTNEAEIANSQTDDALLDQLRRQLETEIAKLKNRRQNASVGRPTKYSVVPHNGPDGTQRRPIYIECLNDKLVIQPYQIELSSTDFVRPIVANNPLDAALIAVREYFLANNLNQAGQTPYPLLVVRPQGAESYSVARHAIRSWDEEFGYELVAADKQLDYGIPDSQLKLKLLAAIEAARRRQRAYVANRILSHSLQETSGSIDGHGSGEALRASSQLGGFVGPNGSVASSNRSQDDTENNDFMPAAETESSNQSGSGNADMDGGENGESSMLSIAQSKGDNWALPEQRPDSVGYRRPVIVYVSQHEMVVASGTSTTPNNRIPFAASGSTSAERLVEAVRQQIETWGVAGVSSYWKPELVVKIVPGGRQRYDQLVALMRGSGIDVRETTQ